MTDSPTRIFLGLDRPALHGAVDRLLAAHQEGRDWDMTDAAVIVPGGRAGRRLLELLVERAGAERLLLSPPRITTTGHLPELLYKAHRPVIGDLAMRLAWAEALRDLDESALQALMPVLPELDDGTGWLALAEQIVPVMVELAGAGLTAGNVAERGSTLFDEVEAARWQTLADAAAQYEAHLDELDVTDQHLARRHAIDTGAIHWDGPLCLLGTVQLTEVARRMLAGLADRVTAMVFADDSHAERFDAWGCVDPAAWRDATIELDDERMHLVANPAAQADRVLRALAESPDIAPEEVTIGAADASVVPHIQRQAELVGWPTRYAEGRKAGQSSVALLLQSMAEYLDGRVSRAFAALIRHPDLEPHLRDIPGGDRAAEDWPTFHDRYLTDHLQARYAGDWLGDDARRTRMKAVHDALHAILGPLDGPARPIHEWAQPITAMLNAVYGDQPLRDADPAQHQRVKVLKELIDVLGELVELPPALGEAMSVTAGEALRLIVRQISESAIAPEPDDAAVELVGWLELPLDDAPHLIVTGMNDTFVPESVTAHPFLPNALREQLNLNDNAARYARDAYALSAMVSSREAVHLIAGRRTGEGDPLVPSRLLFADTAERVAARVQRFYQDDAVEHRPLAYRRIASSTTSVFNDVNHWPPPPPDVSAIETPTALPVTAFRAYLACPYRFYLRYVLGLDAVDDSAIEIEAHQFGNVAHAVLESFGNDAIAGRVDATDRPAIEQYLTDQLDQQFAWRYGDDLRVVLQVQREMLRRRLGAFARWQAKRAAAGWRITHAECKVNDAAIDVDGKPFGLRGRIDRVDVHRETGRLAIFDYKTSDTAKSPDQAHRKGRAKQWVDLQLPLYRHLAARAGLIDSPDAEVILGYIALPKTSDDTGDLAANWSADELAEADETAGDVIRAIRDRVFYPPGEVSARFDDFAAICGTELRRDIAPDDDGGDP
jgi:ATP-dependent helicase/nuclease subunit B